MIKAHCIDIMNIKEFPPYDIVYTDPPWEQKMVNTFETMMVKAGGVRAGNNIDSILDKLAKLCNSNKPVYIEYSVKGFERVITHMGNHGHKLNVVSKHIYAVNSPYVVMSFNTSKPLPNGFKNHAVIDYVMNIEKPKIVVDPFAGIGRFAKVISKHGIDYIGYELNPSRYERLKMI